MIWSHSTDTDINVPRETVYAYLADFERHAEWSANVREIVLVSGDAGTVGAEYRAREDAPADLTTFARITALEPPERIAWQATDYQVFKTEWEFALESPSSGTTHLTQRVTFHTLNVPAEEILNVWRVPLVPDENAKSLARIKQILEK